MPSWRSAAPAGARGSSNRNSPKTRGSASRWTRACCSTRRWTRAGVPPPVRSAWTSPSLPTTAATHDGPRTMTAAPPMKLDGTVLGFDVGARRIGVAVGSAYGSGARALAVIDVHAHGPDWTVIDRLRAEWRPD